MSNPQGSAAPKLLVPTRLDPWPASLLIAAAHAVALSAGWRRRVLALLAGAIGALAMAPVDLAPAMIVPMTLAVWLIDGTDQAVGDRIGRGHLWPSLRSAAVDGWWWGFGYFLAGLWWLGAACLVEPDKFAWALPISVAGVPAVLAVFSSLGFMVSRALWMPGPGRVLSLAVGIGVSEWLRSFVFTGFPWNEFGMAFGNVLVLAQAASLIGVHGLTLVAIAVCAAPATLADTDPHAALPARWSLRAAAPALLAVGLVAVAAGWGAWRLRVTNPGMVAGVKLRIMQPNITQDEEFTYARRHEILQRYLTLSDKATSPDRTGLADITHLVWPESPFPFILSREPDALDAISTNLPGGTLLLTGAARRDGFAGSPAPRYYNSIQVVAKGGEILDTYDKVHLVPFGEYLPFGGLLQQLGIEQFVAIPGGFEAGARQRLMNVPGLPTVVPAICYEAIFSGAILPPLPDNIVPGLILNLTNDSWFGTTPGPYQHFSQVRLRAIEEGLPLVRAANTGISAMVDPLGRIVGQIPLGVADVLDVQLPDRIAATPFARFHNSIPAMLSALLFSSVFLLKARAGRR